MHSIHARTTRLLVLTLLLGCGGDSNEPEAPFPDVSGVYELTGGFDELAPADGSFTGTLELTQASRESGALDGSAAILVDLDGDVFNISDDALTGATVSPSGVVTFTLGGAGATWTFTGTASGTGISQGRHTLAADITISGSWQAARATGSGVRMVGRKASTAELLRRLVR
jgi:hypothetical protein